ncbi:MAG: DNA photolyase [Nitrospinae bacterium]|nr:DNA photolyase [Nitrospinota bacterium]
MRPYRPSRILVERAARLDPMALRVIDFYAGVPVKEVDRADLLLAEPPTGPDPFGAGKRTLLLARFKGAFVKPCPGSAEMLCCHYAVLSPILNCPLECTYCMLQSYLNRPAITVHTNVEDCLEQLDAYLAAYPPDGLVRLGTGELADSLALEEATGWSERLVRYVAGQPNAILELKTKTTLVEPLLDLDHAGRTVVAWSLNPDEIVRREELKTAGLEERLEAAARVQAAGYLVAFHFDPLVHYHGWKAGYQAVVARLAEAVDPRGVAWVSLGGLRFLPGLKAVIKARFPKSRLPGGEFILGQDKKLRYLASQRAAMYRAVAGWLREWDTDLLIYLCMERGSLWEAALGERPPDRAAVERRFTQRLQALVPSRITPP